MTVPSRRRVAGPAAGPGRALKDRVTVRTERYHVRLEPDENGRFVATVPELPGVISDGKTRREAMDNVREAAEAMLEAQGRRKKITFVAAE